MSANLSPSPRDGTAFEDEVFADLDLAGGDFAEKIFERCTFRKLLLKESIWTKARLHDCVFDSCDLTRIKTTKLALRGVEFIGCRLMGVDWSDVAPNPAVSFEDSNLQFTSFVKVNLTKTRFRRCKLIDVNFIESRLVEADFGHSDLSGCRFERCDLRKADFSDARGVHFDPAKNTVKGAKISLATAVLLASAAGLRVSGFDDDKGAG